MEQISVEKTTEYGLCTSCGICKGVCPKNCITFRRENGMFLPVIDETVCVKCGLCAAVCPGLGHAYETRPTAEETVTGPVLHCYNAWSKDAELRHISASGGVVTTLIRTLLSGGYYDGAFCLDTYDYREQLKTRLYTADTDWNTSNAPKSRYLPVSHENTVAYIKAHRDQRIIFVGTSCAIRGLQAAVKKLGLNREQYLFIGLFCDKVFNYNVLQYFADTYADGKPVRALHFKNKESGGWPGDMKFYPEGSEPFYVPLQERAKAKAYFMPERCLYCVDKLNACADISLGDNYTGKDETKLGSNSVIIRTKIGAAAFDIASGELELREIEVADIQKAQAIDWRLDNLYCGDLKSSETSEVPDLNPGVPRKKEQASFIRVRNASLQKLKAGAVYGTDPAVLKKQIRKDNKKPNPIIHVAKRCYRFAKRKMMRG